MSWTVGVAWLTELLKKTLDTRSRVLPARSRGISVFSKVGASFEAVIAAMSARCSAIPASKAGR